MGTRDCAAAANETKIPKVVQRRLATVLQHITQSNSDQQDGVLAVRPTSASIGNGTKCVVTGGNGFIGLHVVEQLLARGYHVTAAVRDASEHKVAPLLAMKNGGHKGQLTIVGGCDLLSSGAFDQVMAGCEICFHLASPFWMDDRITDPHNQLVAPAEQGTLNVLNACAKAGTVNRVVVTSSFAAVMNNGGRTPWPADFHYTEQHWNTSSAPVDGVFPEPVNAHAYRWSKTVAEKAAWDFVQKHKPRFDVTCILPPMVLGRNTQQLTSVQDINQSSLIIYKMLSGDMPHVNPGSIGFVDVSDVAKAHILAAESGAAAGQRYLCSSTTQTWLHVAGLLQQLFPGRPVPKTCADGSTTQPCQLVDNTKIRSELKMEFVPLAEMLKTQGEAFIAAGLLK